MFVTLDFETYWDADYTLTKMSTSEYIRDKQFEAISCAIKKDKGKPACYFGKDAIAKALAKIDWKTTILLAHHTHFDGLILSHHFGHVPAYYADTLSMARALHPKFEKNNLEAVAIRCRVQNKLPMPDFKGKHERDLASAERKAIAAYNIGDIESCYQAFQKMLKGFPQNEMDLIDLTIRMFADPVLRVDLPLAKKELRREQEAKAKAIADSGVPIETLSSGAKFVAALKAVGVDAPVKPSPSIPDKEIPAIAKSDEEFLALLTHPNQKVVNLVKARLAAKSTIGESRAARLIKAGSTGKLPVYYNYAMAHTHRWSGGDKLNFQNFKQSKKEGGELRKAIKAPAGYQLVVVDAAQIEARVVAWLAEEEWVLQAFREKRDLYCEFGQDVYGRVITKADEEERFVCKTAILGLGFNMGGPKLQRTLITQSINQGMEPVRLPLEICYNVVNTYRKKCAKIEAIWQTANNEWIAAMLTGNKVTYKGMTFEKGKVKMPNGLYLQYPGLDANIVDTMYGSKIQDASYLSARSRTKIYGGLFVENLVQCLARIIVSLVMLQIAKKYRIVMMTHDEIVFLAKTKEAKAALEWAIKLMSTSPDLAPDLPLSAEGKYAIRYSK